MSFRLVPKLVTLNDLDGVMALILCHFMEFGSYRWEGARRRSGSRCRREKSYVRYLIT